MKTLRILQKGNQLPGLGFTTVEMLVAISLFLVVSSLALVTFQVASNSRRIAMSRIDVSEKSRSCLDIISHEIAAAHLNSLSVRPFPEDLTPIPGAHEDLNTPFDDDGDGLYNEESLAFAGVNGTRYEKNSAGVYSFIGDGLDNDGDGQRVAGTETVTVGNIEMIRGAVDTDGDGLPDNGVDEEFFNGLDDDNDGLIDEDCLYPSDMVNFVAPASTLDLSVTYTSGAGPSAGTTGLPVMDLAEVGYALDPERDHLRRRYITSPDPVFNPDLESSSPLGIDGRFLVRPDDAGALKDGNETDFSYYSDILGFDIVGLDFRYYFFDYQVSSAKNDPASLEALGLPDNATVFDIILAAGGQIVNLESAERRAVQLRVNADTVIVYPNENSSWAFVENWQSDRLDISPSYNGIPSGWNPFLNVNNEPEDAVNIRGLYDDLATGEPQKLRQRYAPRRKSTDGLPRMVEVTMFIFDGRRNLSIPARYSSRIFIKQI
jgi:type II secretory pathway pseudopilin PulG